MMAPRPSLREVVLKRRPQFGRGSQHVFEIARHHADHRIAVVVEGDLSSDDRRIAAEAAPPQGIAENGHVRPVEAILGRLKIPSQHRSHAQHPEVTRADALPVELFRLAGAGRCRPPGLENGDRIERAVPFNQRAIHAERSIVARPIAPEFPDHRDASGIGVRQWIEQDRPHGAEDRRRRPYAERQGEHGDRREAGGSAQPPGGVEQIGADCVDHVLPPVVAHLLPDACHAAHLQTRPAAGFII